MSLFQRKDQMIALVLSNFCIDSHELAHELGNTNIGPCIQDDIGSTILTVEKDLQQGLDALHLQKSSAPHKSTKLLCLVGPEWISHIDTGSLSSTVDLVILLEQHQTGVSSFKLQAPSDAYTLLETTISGNGIPFVSLVCSHNVNPSLMWVFISRDDSVRQSKSEKQYMDLLSHLLAKSTNQQCPRKDRTGTGTLSTFGHQLKFNISRSVPLLTTKKVNPFLVIEELLFFLRGDTNSKLLEARGVNIWKANTTRAFLDQRGLTMYSEGDMGPMYGYQWRSFGKPYSPTTGTDNSSGVDQLAMVEHLLKNDPFSRRIIMTTYNPSQLDQMVLHPCHGLVVQFYVNDDKQLSCHMYQRSVDVGLGLVWNIFSYAVLTRILALRAGYEAHELIISTGDTHVYFNHIDPCKEQLGRTPRLSPELVIDMSVASKDWDAISVDDFKVCGYYPHPFIKMTMAV